MTKSKTFQGILAILPMLGLLYQRNRLSMVETAPKRLGVHRTVAPEPVEGLLEAGHHLAERPAVDVPEVEECLLVEAPLDRAVDVPEVEERLLVEAQLEQMVGVRVGAEGAEAVPKVVGVGPRRLAERLVSPEHPSGVGRPGTEVLPAVVREVGQDRKEMEVAQGEGAVVPAGAAAPQGVPAAAFQAAREHPELAPCRPVSLQGVVPCPVVAEVACLAAVFQWVMGRLEAECLEAAVFLAEVGCPAAAAFPEGGTHWGAVYHAVVAGEPVVEAVAIETLVEGRDEAGVMAELRKTVVPAAGIGYREGGTVIREGGTVIQVERIGNRVLVIVCPVETIELPAVETGRA